MVSLQKVNKKKYELFSKIILMNYQHHYHKQKSIKIQ